MNEEQKKAASERMKKVNADRRVRKEETQPSQQAAPENKRAASERRSRRMDVNSHSFENRMKLTVDPSIIKEGMTYRWERPENLNQRYESDWDIVRKDGAISDERDSKMESTYSRIVGNDEYGNPVRNVLIAKHQDWHDADRKAKVFDRIDKTQEQLSNGSAQGKTVENSYFPNEEKQALRIEKSS